MGLYARGGSVGRKPNRLTAAIRGSRATTALEGLSTKGAAPSSRGRHGFHRGVAFSASTRTAATGALKRAFGPPEAAIRAARPPLTPEGPKDRARL